MFSFLKNRAAKKYASKLGPYLQKAYGASNTYTAKQINSAVQKLGLSMKYICFGYAAFTTAETYKKLSNDMLISMPRDEALSLFNKYKPSTPYSAGANAETSIDIRGSGYTGSH
ncbi:MAG: hypothetical protein JJ900_15690 [Rhodospirillales bacterium]|nr:hypothetical protein [Rhodospirillales bacterium]MBO6788290.1 hypothetical protein [Rhodospirillales bacterium]